MEAHRSSAADFVDGEFDYVVIGGGTAGLAVAARLSEDPSLSVGVLEAGPAALGDDVVDVPGLYGTGLGSRYDWQFETAPQPGLGGRTLPWPRGRVLGGTSALNFMTWNRASRQDYDAWAALGNAGWAWDDLLPFFQKSESFHAPADDACRREHRLHYDAAAVGTSGPVQVGYAAEYSASHALWHDTLAALGVETNRAHLAGSNVGAWTNLGSVDPRSAARSYAATAYYLPNAGRPNLAVLTDALVTEILLDDDGGWTATGVRFSWGGHDFSVRAAREVILCAGSVQSPQLLELSGIGAPEILARAGVPVKVSNSNVGENLQDHIMAAMIFEVDPSLPSPDDLKHDAAAMASAREQYASSRSGPLTILPNSVCYLPLSHVVADDSLAAMRSDAAAAMTGLHETEKQIRLGRFDAPSSSSPGLGQIEYIFDLGNWSPFFAPDPAAGKKYGTCLQMLQYPFSRGNIHIRPGPDGQPATALHKPLIDPKYYEGPRGALDVDAMARCAAFASEKLAKTAPLSRIIRARVFPPPSSSSSPTATADADAFRDWIVDTTITDWHPVGTCAMGATCETGAVVDARLRVHGVGRLRVVDASVMPLQISAHLQATVYAIAEKGAHMILEDLESSRRGQPER